MPTSLGDMSKLGEAPLGLLDPKESALNRDDSESVDGGSHDSHSVNMENMESQAQKEARRKEEAEIIAKTESKHVFRLKMIFISVLLASTVGMSFGIYNYSRGNERKNLKNRFEDDSTKLLESIGSTLDLSLGAVDSFISNMVSYAAATNSTWPFVTLPDYYVRTSKIRTLTKAVLVTQFHFVQENEREAWEKYATENKGWVDETIEQMKQDDTYKGDIVTEWTPNDRIHSYGGTPSEGPGPYLPKYQQAPVIPLTSNFPYNWNGFLFDELVESFPILLEKRQTNIGLVTNLVTEGNPSKTESRVMSHNSFIGAYSGLDAEGIEPFSSIYYPIIDTAADRVRIHDGRQEDDAGTVRGIFILTVFWRDLLVDVLPSGSSVVAEISNTCNQSFSYHVEGDQATYLGPGSNHNPKFEGYLEKQSLLIDLHDASTGKNRQEYTGLPLNAGVCPFTVRIYASDDLEDAFLTPQPIILTFLAVLIFSFTSGIFLVYDWLVSIRQEKISRTAVQTNAIVSSLFPSNVRSRLMEQGGAAGSNGIHNEPTKSRLKHYLSSGNDAAMNFQRGGVDALVPGGIGSSQPIADLFPNCTVLFADIAGFTAWSSAREPTQVFSLLETIYRSFDITARRRSVFKVETIGDCYVAATGLPEPMDTHAVIMAKFCVALTRDMYRSTRRSWMSIRMC